MSFDDVVKHYLGRSVEFQSLLPLGLGHSTSTLTLDVYCDYIPEDDGGALNRLPEPVAQAKPAKAANVVALIG